MAWDEMSQVNGEHLYYNNLPLDSMNQPNGSVSGRVIDFHFKLEIVSSRVDDYMMMGSCT